MNEERLEEVMRKYTQDLLRVSYYYTQSLQTAQDVVQEAKPAPLDGKGLVYSCCSFYIFFQEPRELWMV